MREEEAARTGWRASWGAGPGRRGPQSAAAGLGTVAARLTPLGAQASPRGAEGPTGLAPARDKEGPRGA